MLIALGSSTKSPNDVVDALLECHQKIRTFTALAITAGERPALVAEDCARIERYFRQALPLHVRDEEESLVPRLGGLRPDLDAALEAMEAEHAQHGPLLDRLFEALASADRAALREAGAALTAAFEPHLQREESIIFPAVRQLVSTETRVAMLAELRARRGSP